MPAPSNPPPADEAGAIVQPRTLNRWLDINPVHQLTRTETFLTVPVFSVDTTWLGYSQLVAAFNFAGSNNYTLKSFSAVVNPNYCLCIMWEDANRVTHRYALWWDVGEVFYFDCPLYTGQLIKKNFRFEIWSVEDSAVVSQSTALTFYTSVRGNKDYMWADDSALSLPSAVITNFAELNTISPLPNDVNNLMLQHFISTVGVTPNVSWQSQNDVTLLTSADVFEEYVNNLYHTVFSDIDPATGATSGNQNFVFMAIWVDGSVGDIVVYDGKPTVSVNGNSITVDGVTIALAGVNKLYFLFVATGIQFTVVDALTGGQAGGALTVSTTPSANLSLLGGNNNGILEMVSYYNSGSFQTVVSYFFAKYGGFTLPLTFPADSVPQLN